MEKTATWNILVVDDTPLNQKLLGTILRHRGYRITPASSGEEALELVAAGVFDLVLLDIMMPGMDGIETCLKMKADANSADIPVLFISAKDSKEAILNAFEAGGVDYILKPFEAKELLARVGAQIEILKARRQLQEMNDNLERLVRNRTVELMEKNVQLERTLQERTLLLGEVHHRVNNNLQLIKSLLSFDLLFGPDLDAISEDLRSRFEARIQSIALVHELLYRSNDFSSIDFVEYSRQLFSILREMAHCPACALELIPERFPLNINMAIPCGLALNELLSMVIADTRTLPEERWSSSIEFSRSGERYSVLFRFPRSLSGGSALHPFGMERNIVGLLVEEQLSGTLEMSEGADTVRFSFPGLESGSFNEVLDDGLRDGP